MSRKRIISIDFDNTLVHEDIFPKWGPIKYFAKETLQALKKNNNTNVLWTCRGGNGGTLEEVIEFIKANDIPIEYFNEEPPEEVFTWNYPPSPKIFADVYIDDRNLGGIPNWGTIYRDLKLKYGHIRGNDNLKDFVVTEDFFKNTKDLVFVYGDNDLRMGSGGAAKFRYEVNTYGFVTKKAPSGYNDAYYTPEEYKEVYEYQVRAFKAKLNLNPDIIFLVSKIGAGLANEYKIFEEVIEPRIKEDFKEFKNVEFLW